MEVLTVVAVVLPTSVGIAAAQSPDTAYRQTVVVYVDGHLVNWRDQSTFPADSAEVLSAYRIAPTSTDNIGSFPADSMGVLRTDTTAAFRANSVAVLSANSVAVLSADSVEAIARLTVDRLRLDGHLFAAVDSITGGSPVRIYSSTGPDVRVGEIRFIGDPALEAQDMRRMMETRSGGALRQNALEDDIRFLLEQHSRRGWPIAEARVSGITMIPDRDYELRVEIRIDRGPPVVLDSIEIPGADRTRPAYIGRLAGLRTGKPIMSFDPAEIRRRILATNHFREVGEPRIELRPDGDAVVVIPVEEDAPGNFDLVLGYVPEAAGAGSGGLVGNGHLGLRNLFGGGRLFNLSLKRLPGRVSSLDAGAADPNIAGLPIGIEGAFHGLQQDSTYDQQRYSAAFSYEISDGLRILAGAAREVTKPGQAGLELRSGHQRIPRATAAFFGIGVRYESVDWPVNPRRGLRVESMFERGNKNRTARIIESAGDTLTSRTRLDQERLTLRVRYFLPTFDQQLIALGTDAQVILSDEYDESDLIRLGGARSLRGYNEEQFLGRLAGRLLLEYRYQLDRYSFAYLFGDLGVLETVPSSGQKSRREVLPGFGIGMQFRTEVGIINVSYAFNDEDGLIDGRVHVGLSFNL